MASAGRLLERVREVRGQSERNTEDVVKSFLLALGHEERAVTFQRGRIDIHVGLPDGGTHMVVEVKRNLQKRLDEARRQGFDYANQVDAMLVVLTDADHYEVYDRTSGSNYDAMLAGRFRLTGFSAADAATLRLISPL